MKLSIKRGARTSSIRNRSGSTLIYAFTVFVGAFLLFQVQPLIGKYILPWFGGSVEVWTACLLFFQALLLGGYAYAHLSVRYFGTRVQAAIHVVLIGGALLQLPITPRAGGPQSIENPTLQIMLLLAGSIGLPYFVLSATGPLVQRWFSRTNPGTSPYPLYALSSVGSLLALVSYPFVVEPALSRQTQAKVWSLVLVVFGILCAWCAVGLWRTCGADDDSAGINGDRQAAPPDLAARLLWLALPAVASMELLAVTNKICQDLAAVPFLWILPLGLYLLSFIVCFHSPRWYVRPVFLIAFMLSIGGLCLARVYAKQISATQQILIFSAMLLACCMVCHGELFKLRPHPRYLTHYYLLIAAGGAAGSFFVAVVAPLVFNTYRELYLGILACCILVLLADKSPALGRGVRKSVWISLMLIAGTAWIFLEGSYGHADQMAVLRLRNFFGVLTIWEKDRHDPAQHRYVLQHGTTFLGLQFVDPKKRFEPTAYYGRDSGVGLALRSLPRRADRRIGVVGLGVGTLAAYAKQGDYLRFYEINPAVKRLANEAFGYLQNCPADVRIVMGDARLSMETERPQGFDLLILDAFTSDAVPVHLLTREAFDIYLRHLTPDGVIAVHVSTVHLDLQSVVFKMADHFNLGSAWIESGQSDKEGTLDSDWILLTRDEGFLKSGLIRAAASRPRSDFARIRLWTDDHVDLFQILK